MGKGKDGGIFACCGAAAICVIVLIVIGLAALGIAKIVMGAIYLHECDIERMIPIFLIVSGVAPMFTGGAGKQDEDGVGVGVICGIIGLLFNVAWLIAGSVWTYGTWQVINADTYVPCTGNSTIDPTGCTKGTCNDSLLKFAFATVTIDWILIGLCVIMIVCYCVRAIQDRRMMEVV